MKSLKQGNKLNWQICIWSPWPRCGKWTIGAAKVQEDSSRHPGLSWSQSLVYFSDVASILHLSSSLCGHLMWQPPASLLLPDSNPRLCHPPSVPTGHSSAGPWYWGVTHNPTDNYTYGNTLYSPLPRHWNILESLFIICAWHFLFFCGPRISSSLQFKPLKLNEHAYENNFVLVSILEKF